MVFARIVDMRWQNSGTWLIQLLRCEHSLCRTIRAYVRQTSDFSKTFMRIISSLLHRCYILLLCWFLCSSRMLTPTKSRAVSAYRCRQQSDTEIERRLVYYTIACTPITEFATSWIRSRVTCERVTQPLVSSATHNRALPMHHTTFGLQCSCHLLHIVRQMLRPALDLSWEWDIAGCASRVWNRAPLPRVELLRPFNFCSPLRDLRLLSWL